MWSSVIAFLSAPAAPYFFCAIILGVFFYCLIDGWTRLNVIRTQTGRALATIEQTSGTEHFYEQFETIADRLGREGMFGILWNEFSKTVVLDGERRLVRITRRPQEFFNSNSVIAPALNLRLFHAMPGYLISLGLFFTFIGLVAAIAVAANGLGADAAQAQAALVQLLDIASLKFISSVAGISLSIILSFVQKTWLNNAVIQLHRFCAATEKRTQLITTEQLLHQWLQAQAQTTRGYAHLAEDVATEVALKLHQGR